MGNALSIFQKINAPASLKDMQKFTSRMNKALEELYDKVYGYIELSDMAKSTQKIINAKTDTETLTKIVDEINSSFSQIRQTLSSISLVVQEMDNEYSRIIQEPGKISMRVKDISAGAADNLIMNGGLSNESSALILPEESAIVVSATAAGGYALSRYINSGDVVYLGAFLVGLRLASDDRYTMCFTEKGAAGWSIRAQQAYGYTAVPGADVISTWEMDGAETKHVYTFGGAGSMYVYFYAIPPAEAGAPDFTIELHSVAVNIGDTSETITWSEYSDVEDATAQRLLEFTRANGIVLTGQTSEGAMTKYMKVQPDSFALLRTIDDAVIAALSGGAFDTGNGVAAGKKISITLTVAGWSDNEQQINITGLSAGNALIISPAPASKDAAERSGVYCSEELGASGVLGLVFTCSTTPTEAITMNVLALGGLGS